MIQPEYSLACFPHVIHNTNNFGILFPAQSTTNNNNDNDKRQNPTVPPPGQEPNHSIGISSHLQTAAIPRLEQIHRIS